MTAPILILLSTAAVTIATVRWGFTVFEGLLIAICVFVIFFAMLAENAAEKRDREREKVKKW